MKRCTAHEEPLRLRHMIAPVLLALLMALAFAQSAGAREIVDATGRSVTVPDAPARVFAAGPPASALLYALAPETMVGWVRAPRAADLRF